MHQAFVYIVLNKISYFYLLGRKPIMAVNLKNAPRKALKLCIGHDNVLFHELASRWFP